MYLIKKVHTNVSFFVHVSRRRKFILPNLQPCVNLLRCLILSRSHLTCATAGVAALRLRRSTTFNSMYYNNKMIYEPDNYFYTVTCSFINLWMYYN